MANTDWSSVAGTTTTYTTPAVTNQTTYKNPTREVGYLLLDDTYYLLEDDTDYFIISAQL